MVLVACGKTVEFSKLKQSVGMSRSQVKTAFGKPDAANGDSTEEFWYYDTISPTTDNPTRCQLQFLNGQDSVSAVNCV